MAEKVTTPGGETWKVGRRWLPFRPRRFGLDLTDVGPGFDIGDLGPISAVLGAIALILVLVFVVIPLLALAVQLVALLLALIVGVLLRVVFRRPWTVVARRVGGPRTDDRAWRVSGWRDSGEVVTAAAERLRRGDELPAAGAWPAL